MLDRYFIIDNNVYMRTNSNAIVEYKVRKSGLRGVSLTLPPAWCRRNELAPGDTVSVGTDDYGRLILEPVKEDR